jgi:hypothetical protein
MSEHKAKESHPWQTKHIGHALSGYRRVERLAQKESKDQTRLELTPIVNKPTSVWRWKTAQVS